ncbi:hypothetical protein ACFLYR_07590 [Chloroflexota bacterium]
MGALLRGLQEARYVRRSQDGHPGPAPARWVYRLGHIFGDHFHSNRMAQRLLQDTVVVED